MRPKGLCRRSGLQRSSLAALLRGIGSYLLLPPSLRLARFVRAGVGHVLQTPF